MFIDSLFSCSLCLLPSLFFSVSSALDQAKLALCVVLTICVCLFAYMNIERSVASVFSRFSRSSSSFCQCGSPVSTTTGLSLHYSRAMVKRWLVYSPFSRACFRVQSPLLFFLFRSSLCKGPVDDSKQALHTGLNFACCCSIPSASIDLFCFSCSLSRHP